MSGNTSAEATADDRDRFEQCKNDHATELLDPAQQLNRPRLLIVIEKKRLMCTTHSASLREQPNGWWI